MIIYTIQLIQDLHILGFDNFKAALVTHNKQKRENENIRVLGNGTGALSETLNPGTILCNFVSDSDEDNSHVRAVDILRNFDSDRDREVSDSPSFDVGENKGEEDKNRTSRKPGEKYTALDFSFLDEEWLSSVSETSEDGNSDDSTESE